MSSVLCAMASGSQYVGVTKGASATGGGILVRLPTNDPVKLSSANGVVTSISAGTGVAVSPSGGQGDVVVSNTGVLAVSAGTGVTISGTASNPVINASATGTVTSVSAGTGVTVTGTATAPVVNNAGVLTVAAGSGVTVSGTAQNPVVNNAGVTGLVAGAGISLSGGTGSVTITNTVVPGTGVRADATNTAAGISAYPTFVVGGANTAYGASALDGAGMTGQNNTATGCGALAADTTGSNNTADGSTALLSLTTGNYNTASGALALRSVTTSSDSTAVGANALQNATAASNTAVGAAAGVSVSTGTENVIAGAAAANTLSTGNYNTIAGGNAAQTLTTGSGNTFVGHQITGTTTGSYNTFIGKGANADLGGAAANYSIALGYNATVSTSNQLSVGSANPGEGLTTINYNTASSVASKLLSAVVNGIPVQIPLGPEVVLTTWQVATVSQPVSPPAYSAPINNITSFNVQLIQDAFSWTILFDDNCSFDYAGFVNPLYVPFDITLPFNLPNPAYNTAQRWRRLGDMGGIVWDNLSHFGSTTWYGAANTLYGPVYFSVDPINVNVLHAAWMCTDGSVVQGSRHIRMSSASLRVSAVP